MWPWSRGAAVWAAGYSLGQGNSYIVFSFKVVKVAGDELELILGNEGLPLADRPVSRRDRQTAVFPPECIKVLPPIRRSQTIPVAGAFARVAPAVGRAIALCEWLRPRDT
jgi:hypothetical protein